MKCWRKFANVSRKWNNNGDSQNVFEMCMSYVNEMVLHVMRVRKHCYVRKHYACKRICILRSLAFVARVPPGPPQGPQAPVPQAPVASGLPQGPRAQRSTTFRGVRVRSILQNF